MKHTFALSLSLTFALAACAEAEKDDVSSDYASTNVTTTETDGTVTGSFKKDAITDQIMLGSQSSANKETFISLPPGALAIDTEISMSDGANDNPNVLPSALELGDTAILGGSDPVLLSSSAVAETSSPYALNIPLPLAEVADKASLALADGTSKVGILYLVKTKDEGNKIGLFVLGQDDLIGTIVRYKGARFGWFRLVLLSKAVASVEKTTEQEPPAKK
jgi:hypothetical protein